MNTENVDLDVANKQIQEDIEARILRNSIIENNQDIQLDVLTHIETHYPSLKNLGMEVWQIDKQAEYERMQELLYYVNDKFEQLNFDEL